MLCEMLLGIAILTVVGLIVWVPRTYKLKVSRDQNGELIIMFEKIHREPTNTK